MSWGIRGYFIHSNRPLFGRKRDTGESGTREKAGQEKAGQESGTGTIFPNFGRKRDRRKRDRHDISEFCSGVLPISLLCLMYQVSRRTTLLREIQGRTSGC